MNKLTKCGKYLIKCILYTRRRWALSFAQHVRWAEAVSAKFRVKMNELNTIQYNTTVFLERLTKKQVLLEDALQCYLCSDTSLSAVMSFEKVSFKSGFERWSGWRFTDDNR